MTKLVYKSLSGIPNIGDGLFSGEDINPNELIAEFTGKLLNNLDNITSCWSVMEVILNVIKQI
jgi:hypothetical protein